jgi:predicted O-linked N-acetylglucosamine transferase (SPINDLY family)
VEQGRLDEAVASLQQAQRLQPGDAETYHNLGIALNAQGKLDEAVASLQQALRLKPDFVEAHNNLGNALQAQGRLDEAVSCYRQALRLKADCAEAHSNLLLSLHYRADVTLRELAEAHADYERQFAAPLRSTWKPHGNVRNPERQLRLGFVSPDLRRHPVAYFLIRFLENLDRGQCEAICYSNRPAKDDVTTRIQAAAATFRDVFAWSDEHLVEQIRSDQIDILFDLAGHTAKNRLRVFARKPAPIQVTWLGYVGTTGLRAMDYILADRHVIPAGAEAYYCERVLRLPDGYVCYDPPSFAPGVLPLPALERQYVTFASFNNPAKIAPQVVAVWATILRRLPQARLVLKYKALHEASVAVRFREMFAGHGIDPGRVALAGWSGHQEFLEQYNGVDIALDPFPHNGGMTTCEALWMGVPVITCPGTTFAGRQSLTHLSNIGLTETIAHNLDEYADLAVALAGDLARLAAIRAGLRSQVAVSPLCDGQRFAGNLMKLLRGAWREWVAGGQK